MIKNFLQQLVEVQHEQADHFLIWTCARMEPISFLCAVFLVCLCPVQGSSAVTPVFVQKGKDVILNVTKADVPEDFLLVAWKFDKTVILVTFVPGREPTVSSVYTGRIEFTEKEFSVKLKNLQEADSGVYTLTATGIQEAQTLEYNVTVQDPVSPVGLTVDSVSNSSDSCNLTVTCSTRDSHISSTFRCDNETCSQEGGGQSKITASGASLHVYLVNGLIMCNHSNQVSQTKNITVIEHFCPRHAGSDPQRHNKVVAITLGLGLVVFIIIGVILYCRKRRKYKTKTIENTVYEVPQVKNRAQPLSPTDASGLSPTSTYCLVGPHTGPPESRETSKTQPESVYAQI